MADIRAIGDAPISGVLSLPEIRPEDPVTGAAGKRIRKAFRRFLKRYGEQVEIERDGAILGSVPAWVQETPAGELAGEELKRREFDVYISPASLAVIGVAERLEQTDIIRRYADQKPDGDVMLTLSEPPIVRGLTGVPAIIHARADAG